MTTATRPRCDTTWPAIDRAGRRSPIPHTCRRALAADDHDDGLHVCDCTATRRVTEGERT